MAGARPRPHHRGDIDEARALFEEIAGPALRSLPPAEAGLERARLLGSAVGSGIVDRVFAMEAERGADIRERLMEYQLDGDFTFAGEDGAAARRPAARQDRSRRPARRRHVPADRLQDEVRARPRGRRCSCRSTAPACARRSRRRTAATSPPAKRCTCRSKASRRSCRSRSAASVRRADDVGRASAGRGARRHCRRPLSAAARDQESLHDVRVRGGVPASWRGREVEGPDADTRAAEGTEGSDRNA